MLQQFPDGTTFVDLFGGSGLLSHIAKCQKPNSTVVYNDFDGYRQRLEALPVTNALLAELREIVDVPRHRPVLGESRERVLSCIRRYERDYGYIDYITLSSSVMFSMKYANNFAELEKDITMVGTGARIEIWDKKAWEKGSTYDNMDDIAEHMGEWGFGI